MMSQFPTADAPFALVFIALHLALMGIRLRFRLEAGDLKRPLVNRAEGVGNVVARWTLGSILIGAVVAYFVSPREWEWMFLRVPTPLRVAGAVASILALILLTRAHRALNREFSSTLGLKPQDHLVTWGPYRHIQHPIYVAFFTHFLATGLYTRSWPIGVLGMATILTLMTTRRRREEALLRRAFGERYAEYQAATPRFLPRVRTAWRRTGHPRAGRPRR
ncbi:MAG: methyltransferase family protein [bacterium]